VAATARQRAGQAGASWTLLLRPRWLAWHTFAVLAAAGMIWLGDWQLHRALSGNELSWAYTFEWPLFTVFGVYFWIKSLRDELREHGTAVAGESQSGTAEFTAVSSAPAAAGTAVAEPAASSAAAATDSGVAAAAGVVSIGQRAASWDATSWDATSWHATSSDTTGQQASGPGAAPATPVDIGRATPADGDAYLARLMAEVQRPGRGRARR
jgi:hypothetical protein